MFNAVECLLFLWFPVVCNVKSSDVSVSLYLIGLHARSISTCLSLMDILIIYAVECLH